MSTIVTPAAKDVVKDTPIPQTKPAAVRYPFWFGGSAASMAAVVTHPLDLGRY